MKSAPTYVSFDCYGTLVDWESGICNALLPWLQGSPVHQMTAGGLLGAYARLEPAAESGPYKPYREVLALVVEQLALDMGLPLATGERNRLADSLGQWPIFPDTIEAIRQIRRRHKVAILSNVDRDLIAQTLRHNGLEVDLVVTAEDVRAYKPAKVFFEEGIRRMDCRPGSILHCGCSKYHDIGPAGQAGMRTAWINRRSGEGGSATPQAEAAPDLVFTDLKSLAAWLDA